MTQVVTMSATTAAYAAQAVKPSARVSGDGASEEAITLLSARPKDEANAYAAVAALRSPTALSLMLMTGNGRLPQGTRDEAIRCYREFAPDDPEPEDPLDQKERDEDPQEDEDAFES